MRNHLKTEPDFGYSVSQKTEGVFTVLQRKNKTQLLIGLSLIGIVATFFTGPISQNLAYHHFADSRTISGIPNFLDVVSNVTFVLIGLWGLVSVGQERPAGMFPELKAAYL